MTNCGLSTPVTGHQEGIYPAYCAIRRPRQSRYWERAVRDEAELQSCVDYVHINPLKHGLVNAVADWPHSTFHRYVRKGWLSQDWAGSPSAPGMFGER